MEAFEVTSTHSSEFDGSSIVGLEDDSDPSNAFVERVRVDRKKLEEMLQENGCDTPTMAERFFQKIMETTDTIITWPTKLKAGAKSKKDPHVKVRGLPDAVARARESILELLDTKRNRVTMKMDVSFTDHSYIIGKGGHNIQQVMDNTGCHIHFPDSNRNSQLDKSNQVSIAGQPRGVESARNQIRELLPMVVSFELPLHLAIPTALDHSSMALQGILKSHGITVTFRPLHAALTLVVVKGSRRYADRLRQGLVVLIEYLTGGSRTHVGLVTLSTEIAPHHHSFVMGHGNCNVQQIARQTGCVITFPDPATVAHQSTSVLPPFLALNQQTCSQGLPVGFPSKSTVQITGSFDAVYNAWLELMGWLPLVLMFDLKEGQDADLLTISRLMDQTSVHICIKPKPKRNCKCIVARCAEKDSQLLFEVRRIILNLDTDELGSSSPLDKIPYSPPQASFKGRIIQEQLWREIKAASQHQAAAAAAAAAAVAAAAAARQQQQQLFWNGLLNCGSFVSPAPRMVSAPLHHYQQQQQQAALLPLLLSQLSLGFRGQKPPPFEPSGLCSHSSHSLCSTSSERLPSPDHSGSCGHNASTRSCSSSQESAMDSGYGFGSCDEGHQPCNADGGCYTWEESTNREEDDTWKKALSHGSPTHLSQEHDCSPRESYVDSSMPQYQKNMGPVGCERKVTFGSPLPRLDYERRKLLATKAMQEHVGSTKRVPSSTWSGFGFSKSMPESAVKGQIQLRNTASSSRRPPKLEETKVCSSIDQASPSKVWSNPADACLGAAGGSIMNDSDDTQHCGTNFEAGFSASNFFECVGAHSQAQEKQIIDIPHLFSQLGLGRYVDVFQQHEIDLETFLHMTDSDLQQLCIPYGARKKMLLAMSDINSRALTAITRTFQAAPGAELQSPNQSPSRSLVNACW